MGAPQCQPGSWLGPELHKALWGVGNLSVGGEGWGTWLCPGPGTLKPWVMQMGVRLWFGVQILTPCVYPPPARMLPPLCLPGCKGSPGAGWVPDVGSGVWGGRREDQGPRRGWRQPGMTEESGAASSSGQPWPPADLRDARRHSPPPFLRRPPPGAQAHEAGTPVPACFSGGHAPGTRGSLSGLRLWGSRGGHMGARGTELAGGAGGPWATMAAFAGLGDELSVQAHPATYPPPTHPPSTPTKGP